MKKFLILISFFLFFNASLDESDIDIELNLVDAETFEVSWSINIEDYDQIILKINHKDSLEQYQILSSQGSIELCCYSGEVEVSIKVLVTKSVEQDSDECEAVNCYEFIKETYYNTANLTLSTTTSTTSTTTTTAILFFSWSVRSISLNTGIEVISAFVI